jgi:glucosamine kinase
MHDDGRVISRVTGKGRNLRSSIDRAWAVILDTIAACFADAGLPFIPRHCMVGIGIAGGHHAPSLAEFKARAPAFAALAIDTDSFIHLLGAHGGKPGSVAAFGTGSIGESLLSDGTRRLVGGYGFPAGDRASGAWLGLEASRHLQDALDGVIPFDDLAGALADAMGVTDRADTLEWLGKASPAAFAGLVPIALAHRENAAVERMLSAMARDAAIMLGALQRHQAGPIALCGGLGPVLLPLLPDALQGGLVEPAQDGAAGAITLVRSQLDLLPVS